MDGKFAVKVIIFIWMGFGFNFLVVLLVRKTHRILYITMLKYFLKNCDRK